MGSAFEGTEKGDLFTAHYDAQAITKVHTLSALDELDGGAGKDTLKITSDDTTAYTMADATIKNIETITIKGAAGVSANVAGSNITGLETISILKSVDAEVHANSTTDVNVSAATGTIEVSGGKNVVVNDATTDKVITIGETSIITGVTTTNAVGTITVTDTKLNDGNIVINGGTDVTVTATSDKTNTVNGTDGIIEIGTATQATGDVVVIKNLNSDGVAAFTADVVKVTGGKTVDVTVNSTITAKDALALSNIANGDVTVDSDGKTTDVTVKQNSTVAEFVITPEAALVNGKTAITFKAMTAGQALSIDGLSFHATKNLTAAEVAAAFANLTALGTQSATGTTANGYYTGALLTGGLTTGAANGAVVEFISSTNTPVTFNFDDLANPTTLPAVALDIVGYEADPATPGNFLDVDAIEPAAPTTTTGTLGSTETKTGNTVVYGDVTVDEDLTAAASITTVTLDGFANADLGTTYALNALTTLNIANSAGTTTLGTTKTALTLNVDNITNIVTLDDAGANITTLTINATGKKSDFALTADAVETLTIAAAADLDLTGSSLTALKTATITGAGDVDLDNLSTLADFATLTASAATGNITATVDGTKATVTTGSGNDTITVTSTTVTNAITLGAGDDTLDLSDLNDLTDLAAIAGGAETDTVVLGADEALVAALSSVPNSTIFKSKVTGFEKLEIFNNLSAATGTVNVGNLGYNYVITNAILTNVLTLADMANNGTVELNAAASASADKVIVEVKNADTGATDVLKVVLKTTNSGEDAGTLEVDDVETINISTVELDSTNSDSSTELILVATSAKTVNVAGDADLTLDMTGNTAATLIDGSKMTGDLIVTAFNSGMTVKGGDGDDTLSVFGSATISVSGVVLTGGKGTDTFDVSLFNSLGNAGTAVTITDLTAGETIVFEGSATNFVSSKVTLISESTFTEYVAEATTVANGNIAWFQFNNNTFVVQDVSSGNGFDAGDIIVKINGVKDLSTASFNATEGTLEIA